MKYNLCAITALPHVPITLVSLGEVLSCLPAHEQEADD